ncbi:CBS domain containing protein [Alkaliphilus metalliredigens QYMF]|uniref:CBS domain containing protein n=2 Tax=Alkaliphilus TaxID=114627 RepID=A6TVM9_ALKMQ|nr:CBS domain containing protein [Alkaliphilus metalliredigens QYMF]
MKARDIMTRDVISVTKEDTVEKVVKLLLDNGISGLPVVDEENHVVGIITEGDLIYRSKKLKIPSYFTLLDSYIFLENPQNLGDQIKKMVGYKVEDVMTKKVVKADINDSVEDVATLMTSKNVNRIPVVENEILVGIVSRRDIIKSYTES